MQSELISPNSVSQSMNIPSFSKKSYATLNCDGHKVNSNPRYRKHELKVDLKSFSLKHEKISKQYLRKRDRFQDIITKLYNDRRYTTKNYPEFKHSPWESKVLNKSFYSGIIIPSPTAKMKETLSQLYNMNKRVFHKRKGMAEEKYLLENSEQRSNANRLEMIMKLNPKAFHKVNGEFTLYVDNFNYK